MHSLSAEVNHLGVTKTSSC